MNINLFECDICPFTCNTYKSLSRHKQIYNKYPFHMSPKVAKAAPFKEILNTFVSTIEDKIEEMGIDAFETGKKGHVWVMKALNGQDHKSRPKREFEDIKIAFKEKPVEILAELTLKMGKINTEIAVIFNH